MTQATCRRFVADQLGVWPTPMQRVDDRLWIKREDLNGFGFGGTKVRALEKIMNAAISTSASALVTGGRRDSNWVALASLAARRAGLGFHAVLDPGDTEPTAVALMRRWGAVVHTASAAGPGPVNATIARLAHELDALAVPRGGASPGGVAGYRPLAAEIVAQVADRPVDIVVAMGSGGLAAGLLVGLDAVLAPPERDDVRVCAVPVGKSPQQAVEVLTRLTVASGGSPASCRLPTRLQVRPARHDLQPERARIEEQHGVLLDPVFAGPAWATYLADRPGDRACVLVASGGLPAVVDQSVQMRQ